MENPIKGLIDQLSKEIIRKFTKDSQQAEPSSSESFKIKNEELRKEFENKVEECKSKMANAVDEAIKDGAQAVNEVKADLAELGTSMGQLTVGTAQFAARIAMIPPAIISATPLGPGVSANLIPPMLQDLKAEGDMLSAVYDNSFNKRRRLRLDELSLAIPALKSVLLAHDSVALVVKPLIMLVGAAVDGSTGDSPSITPPISYNYEADECKSWVYKYELEEDEELEDITRTVDNCKLFSAIFEDKGVNCNNCKNFR